ncbi:MAG: S-adenosyl-l-methionine hydroxide adenosyltransferase family protein [Crenarchaeota archaeon]|nr:S-adenosyl-l-methionine hydroxide adenosyltransferase family protein [Thermoproteota archaeon]MCR8501080.1 S-adenosyl-l-methionine hydroxide adenosyltransferase family protein [Thermoproteota archaeon]
MNRIIALITDFGVQDPFVGIMKGVIYRINPNAKIVDLSHGIPNFNVKYAAFILKVSYKYFPKETIFCCVVDPGVGTTRRGIAIKTRNFFFVGPDNGCLSMAALEDGIITCVELKNREFMLPEISTTFHGRDIFAPVSAYLSIGVPITNLGPVVDPQELVRIELPKPTIENGFYEAEVLAIDSFGNIFLNVPCDLFSELIWTRVIIETQGKKLEATVGRTFGDVPLGRLVLLKETSHGYLEIAANQASAKDLLNVKLGDKITIRRTQ